LQEDPWRRLELLREQVPNIPFQMLLRGANAVGYTSYADNVVQSFVHQARKSGIDVFRVFDSLNYEDNLMFGIDAVRNADGVVEATICYTGDVSDPKKTKYTLDYYVDLTTKLVEHGIDVLAVKDMAGLLKPRAATMLISAIRAKFPDLPIHVHTHDTASTGVASMLAAAAAGADVVDVCMDAMAGTTSQPAIGAVINSVAGTELDTGLDIDEVLKLNLFWEQTRGLYSPYESGIKSGSSDVYIHEMPGGQYTNLKFQAYANGLGSEWDRIKDSYATANKILGDIVKVTPSSKVVGDFAQFLVANNLDEHSVVEKADTLSFPTPRIPGPTRRWLPRTASLASGEGQGNHRRSSWGVASQHGHQQVTKRAVHQAHRPSIDHAQGCARGGFVPEGVRRVRREARHRRAGRFAPDQGVLEGIGHR
jgi:pyruvate carboxylase